MSINEMPLVLCIDVGGPTKIGWSNSEGSDGTGDDLGDALDHLSKYVRDGGRAALGFEAPIWTPVRAEFARITARHGGVETTHNRAWSAGAGAGALAAGLALMPWCLARIGADAGRVPTTADLPQFQQNGGLFLWEAFVSGAMKVLGAKHHDDARAACQAFIARWPNITSDIPAESAVNHAISSAMAAGQMVDPRELTLPGLVLGVSLRAAIRPAND
jgi:hypothetical protein